MNKKDNLALPLAHIINNKLICEFFIYDANNISKEEIEIIVNNKNASIAEIISNDYTIAYVFRISVKDGTIICDIKKYNNASGTINEFIKWYNNGIKDFKNELKTIIDIIVKSYNSTVQLNILNNTVDSFKSTIYQLDKSSCSDKLILNCIEL
jgi:hypothetical protein